MMGKIIRLVLLVISTIFFGALSSHALDIRFVEETGLETLKRWDTLVDAKATTIFGVEQSFKLKCTGENSEEGAFAFSLSPLIRINGTTGIFIMDCSKGINEFTFSLSREGLDSLIEQGTVSFFTDIEFAGTDKSQNFTPLRMDVNFRTNARKAKLPPDRNNELVSAISKFNFFTEDTEETEERRFKRAEIPTGSITIRAQATFPLEDFESREDLIETFKAQLSTIKLKPNFKTSKNFLKLSNDKEIFQIAEEDIEILNLVNALIKPNDPSSETYLVDFSATIRTSVESFKIASLLKNRKKAVRELKRNNNIRERFLKEPVTKRASLKFIGQEGTIFQDHKRIVIPIIFNPNT